MNEPNFFHKNFDKDSQTSSMKKSQITYNKNNNIKILKFIILIWIIVIFIIMIFIMMLIIIIPKFPIKSNINEDEIISFKKNENANNIIKYKLIY